MIRQTYLSGGRGHILTHVGTNPAAGVNYSAPLASVTIGHLLFVSFQLVCDANAATRDIYIMLDNGVIQYFVNLCDKSATANDTFTYHFGLNLPPIDKSATSGHVQGRLADQILVSSEAYIQITIGNIQAGDQLSNIHFVTEEYYN